MIKVRQIKINTLLWITKRGRVGKYGGLCEKIWNFGLLHKSGLFRVVLLQNSFFTSLVTFAIDLLSWNEPKFQIVHITRYILPPFFDQLTIISILKATWSFFSKYHSFLFNLTPTSKLFNVNNLHVVVWHGKEYTVCSLVA